MPLTGMRVFPTSWGTGCATVTRPVSRAALVFATAVCALSLLLGASLLPAPAPAYGQTPAPAATAAPLTHKVQYGESWTSVAAEYGVTIRQLQAANPRSVRANGWLRVGEVLTIPGQQQPVPAASATPVSTGLQRERP